jgi:Glycosyltransferase family 87
MWVTKKLSFGHKFVQILFFLFALCLCLSFIRYYSKIDDCYFIDLRNRVVGARLIKLGISPYFFKWNSSYPETLLDPIDKCNIKNNMITSPPSLLLLMTPLGGLSYFKICYYWFIIQYLFFLGIVISFYAHFKNVFSRIFLLMTGIILVFSDFWADSIFRGQSHFIFPAMLAIILLLESLKWRTRFLWIGILLSILIWIRPNALLLVPFCFLCRWIDRRYLFLGLSGGALFFVAITFLFKQEGYWLDFYRSCTEWMKNSSSGLKLAGCPAPAIVEFKTVHYQQHGFVLKYKTQITDIFSIASTKFHILLPQVYLFGFFLVTYLSAIYFCIKRPARSFSEALLTGVLLYWMSEMTAPILKMSYYYVELFTVVLFLACKFIDLAFREQCLLLAGLLLSYSFFIPMNLVIAEVATMTALLSYLLRMKQNMDIV